MITLTLVVQSHSGHRSRLGRLAGRRLAGRATNHILKEALIAAGRVPIRLLGWMQIRIKRVDAQVV